MKNKSLKISISAGILFFALLGLKNFSTTDIAKTVMPVQMLIYETFDEKDFEEPIFGSEIFEKENALAEGLNLYYQGKFQESIDFYTEYLKKYPDNEAAYNRRGNVYFLQLQEYDLAIADYSRAIKINSTYWKPYYNRGNVFVTLGNYEEAISDYNKAIALNPNFESAYNSRGICYLMLGEIEKAFADFAKAKIFCYKI